MSQDLLNTYVTGFDRSIRRTVEVEGGKFRSKVRLASGDLYREDGVYQRISGGGLPQKVTNRFGDSPTSEDDYSRRRVSRNEFDDGKYMDWADVIKMGTDPKNEKLISMANKFKRKEDIIITQAGLGSAQGGDNGETATAFDTGNIIPVATGGTASTGFNYEKFIATIELFGNNNVDIEINKPAFVISWSQWRDAMNDDKFINWDYTAARRIDNGTVVLADYMGCDICITNILPYMNSAGTGFNIADADINSTTGTFVDTDTTDVRSAWAFCQDAILFELNPDMTTKISERADKKFNWYAYMKQSLGAVRMEEEKVISIPCDQSPA